MNEPLVAGLRVRSHSAAVNVSREGVVKFLLLQCQLVLIAAIVYLFNIEVRRHFFPVLCAMIGGFAIHCWLPMRYRLIFFAGLSMGSVLFVLGMENGAWVLGLGGGLIAISYLPVPMMIRIILLIAVTGVMAWFRRSHPQPFWPVVGSMFMFRMVTFIYELKRAKSLPPLESSLAYFFLMPNTCFPLFPVIDYKTFCETRFDEDEWEIYQRGVDWIVRGLAHLLLYRYLRAYIVPQQYQLYDITYIALFVVTNYSLYLQVSGQFHLITGLLHLFGFNLPRTHNWFFLASSFSDIWRRINIYWKDFMTKYFFYPAFYSLRYRGASLTVAIVCSVFYVFLSTWILHSWQTFWLLGRFPVTINDACLWLGAGCCVAINALLESRRRVRQHQAPFWAALRLSAQTVGMFILVGTFWACWTKQGFLDLVIQSLGRNGSAIGVLWILLYVLAAIAVGTGFALGANKIKAESLFGPFDFYSSSKFYLSSLIIVTMLSMPRAETMYSQDVAKSFAAFREDPTIAAELGERLEGYYEELNTAKIQAGPLIASILPLERRSHPNAEGFNKLTRYADVYQVTELIPGVETEFDGAHYTVNEFGFRGRKSIPFAKPHGTIRIALIGSSIVMGYGVSDDEVFARQFEQRLNEQYGNSSRRFEVLNFGVGRQWPAQRLIRVQRKVMGFRPDALYYIAHQDEFKNLANQPAELIARRLELPSQHFRNLAEAVGANPQQSAGALHGILTAHAPELLTAIYKTIVDECHHHDTLPVWIWLPIPSTDVSITKDLDTVLFPIAKSSGFITGDLTGWMQGETNLFPNPEDYHPNARGHQLIAEMLIKMLETVPEALPLRPSS